MKSPHFALSSFVFLCITAFSLVIGCDLARPILEQCLEDNIVGEGGCVSEEAPDAPSRPTVTGWRELTEPCVFDFGLESTTGEFFVGTYRQTGGDLPPGYSLVMQESDTIASDAKGRFQGPPVGAGRWSASFVAVDVMGNESSQSEVAFICNAR